MGRFDENPAWKEFLRWMAAVVAGAYAFLAMMAFFLWAEPITEVIISSLGWEKGFIWVLLTVRILILLHTLVVIRICLRWIGTAEGEWPT